MPLLDHFHPPLSTQRHWESFHTTWAGAIADALNQKWLPEGYFAEEQLQPSARVEVDVATFEEAGREQSSGGVALAGRKTWTPAAPKWTMPGLMPDGLEVLVFSGEGGPTLVGAIELVSPANKDRASHRRAFAIKCAGYLQQGVAVVIIDVVTERTANLHGELVDILGCVPSLAWRSPSHVYAVAYRPTQSADAQRLEAWPEALTVGAALPTMPLWLSEELCLPLRLEESYRATCVALRIRV